MNPIRPIAALALTLSSFGLQGCIFTCGDRSFEDRIMDGTLSRQEDGTVFTLDGEVDPDDPEACEALCTEIVSSGGTSISEISGCEATVTEAGDTALYGEVAVTCTVSGESECVGGRHHADLLSRPIGRGRSAVGAWLAREAQGEAGSVVAFARLAGELREHGAPQDLVARAMSACRDEVRHARALTRLARAHGGLPARVRASPPSRRSLVELALENAVEGCVRETYAAAQAGWQAGRAQLPDVREAAARIAPEEGRHAELAWDLHLWLLGRLPVEEGRLVEATRLRAWETLAPDMAPEEVREKLGLPRPAEARALVRELAGRLARAA